MMYHKKKNAAVFWPPRSACVASFIIFFYIPGTIVVQISDLVTRISVSPKVSKILRGVEREES
jgi:hypothetical protein